MWVFGTVAIVFATSFVKGLVNQRIKERIDTSLGHAKLTHKQYDTEKNASCFLNFEVLNFYNKNYKDNFNYFYEKNEFILHKTTRLNVRGLCNKKPNNKKSKVKKNTKNIEQNIVDIYGVNPETETKIFDLHKKIIAGNYLKQDFLEKNEIVIGEIFSKKNNLKVNDTLIIQYFSKEKNFIKRPYIIVGIFATQNENFDKTHIFTHKHTWREFDKNDFHQLVFLLNDYQKAYHWTKAQTHLKQNFQLKSWQQISPDLAYLYEMMKIFFDTFLVLILGISALGIFQMFVVMIQERAEENQKMQDLGLKKLDLMFLFGFEGLIFYLRALPYSFVGLIFIFFVGNYEGINLSWFGDAMRNWGNAEKVFLETNLLDLSKLFISQIVLSFFTGFIIIFFRK